MRRGLRFPKWAARTERRTGKQRRSAFGVSPYHRRLLCEPLEDRRLLSIFVVTGTGDDHLQAGAMFSNPVPGQADTYALPSLRAAVEAANQNLGNDTIEFDSSLANKKIVLQIGCLELSDTTDTTTITGLGANQLTVSGNMAFGVFCIDSGVTAAISGLTISQGYVTNNGGGISNDGTLAVSDSTFSANSGDFTGGGISNDGTLTVTNSTFYENSAYDDGGGISNSGTLTVTNSTFSGNKANCGGGICNAGGTAAVTNSTFSGNSADGGGIYNGGTLTVTNSTLAGNSAQYYYGGGIDNGYNGTLTVNDGTISGNSAGYGGGICNNNSTSTATLNNTIVGGNMAGSPSSPTAAYADIDGPVTANYCLIQNTTTGPSITGSGNLLGVAPLLGTLGNYGGPTQTMPLQSGSPAIDAGSNSLIPSAVTTDQRGPGFARIWGKNVDIGAYEYQIAVVGVSPAQGPAAGGTSATITGTGFTDATAVNFGTTPATTFAVVSDNQITATSPAGTGMADVTVVTPGGTSATSTADQFTYAVVPSVTAISPTSGSTAGGTAVTITGTNLTGATAVNFGSLTATIQSDTATQIIVIAPASATGPVDVTVTTAGGTSGCSTADQFTYQSQTLNLVVTTLVDTLETPYDPANLSLREALALTNSNVGGTNTITFAPSLDGGTISLSLYQLAITDSVTIEGPGATDLTINANSRSGIFDVEDGNSGNNINVEIDGLTLTGGSAYFGGAICSYSAEDLTLDSVNVTGNHAIECGGGIYIAGSDTTIIRNSTISGNSAGYFGGGIYVCDFAGSVTIENSTISGNSAHDDYGGAICWVDGSSSNGAMTIRDSIVSGNSSGTYGGGIFAATSPSGCAMTIQDSTISANSAGSDGGGISLDTSGTTTIQDTTISGNSTSGDGGGICLDTSGTTTVQNSTISANSASSTGGGIWLLTSDTTTIQETTISGNTAGPDGGGMDLDVENGSTTTIQNSTIFGNSTTLAGGGIAVYTWSGGMTTIQNSTIAQNSAGSSSPGYGVGGGVDAAGATSIVSSIIAENVDNSGSPCDINGAVELSQSLIGDNFNSGLTEAPIGAPDANGNFIGGPVHGIIDPKLGPLADNGGPTETCALLAGSSAIDSGANPANLSYDQRGIGYPRVAGAQIDMGAYEAPASVAVPIVTAISPPEGATSGGMAVAISGTCLAGATAVMFGNVAGTIQSDTATRLVLIAPAGIAGTVDVTVTTAIGTSATSSADQFTYVAGPLNLVVTTLADKLDPLFDAANLSLREALSIANANPGMDTITFAHGLDGGTINLSLGELAITDSVSIEGPGATNLTINANGQSRILDVNDGNDGTNIDVTIDGLTLTGGHANQGGAIYSAEDLNLDFVNVTQNFATANGGGIYVVGSTDTVIQNCTISNNTVNSYQSYDSGGGLCVQLYRSGTMAIQNSTISGNYSGRGGGIAAYSLSGTTTIQNCTIAGNNAAYVGGGIWASGDEGSRTIIQNNTIYGNSANSGGGGGIGTNIAIGGTTTIQNSTITGNTADSYSDGSGKGGGIYVYAGTLTVASTIVAGNADYSGTAPDIYGTVTISHSLVGNSTGSGLTEAPVGTPDSNGNLVGGPTYGVIDPKLGPLADNGGPTQTCALLAGSPAIEMGSNPADLFYDQRGPGYPRVLGTQADMGAYEGVMAAVVPAVTSISPTSGPVRGGTAVTITGTGFTGAMAVDFGNTTATFTIDSDTEITAISPIGVGVVDVVVVTASGSTPESRADQFGYAPIVSQISPAQGPATGSTAVTIMGIAFTGATAVDFGGVAATSFTVVSDTEITAISPTGTGTVDVTVTTAGTSPTFPADQFTYVVAVPAPTVTAISRTSGSMVGGATVMITGTNLTGATTVNFGSLTATIQSDTATQIIVIAPASAACTVDVTVTTAGGTSACSTADRFTYIAAAQTPTVGLYDPYSSMFMLRNTNDSGFADECSSYGVAEAGMLPIVGDWTGDGTESIGLYDPVTSTFYLRNTNDSGCADTVFVYGPANTDDEPVVGDWNGDGRDSVGLYDPTTSTFYLRNTNCLQGPNDKGYADIVFNYGPANSGMLPVAGDWQGSGKDGIGLYSQATSTFYLRNTTCRQGPSDKGYADATLNYGAPRMGYLPIAGDWNGDGKDGIGVYDQATATFYLRNAIQLQGLSDHGYADLTFMYGKPNALQLPVVGDWTGAILANHLLAAGGEVAASPDTPALTQADLQPIVPEAIARWSSAGLDAATVQKLTQVQFVIGDLPGSYLGETEGTAIYLDANAAGNGWFIDPTPASDEEFSASAGSQQLRAVDPRAVDRIDLLTVVEHELGHVAGLSDLDALTGDIMDGVLGVGMRRIASHADAALGSV
jgi:parallel beta-helix repeat protein